MNVLEYIKGGAKDMLKAYELLGFEKVNDVDEEKARKIAESIKKNGWQGAPILTYGNCLVTGSHRLRAIEMLYDDDFDLDFGCAYDVTDIIRRKRLLRSGTLGKY